ncbi:MAG: hypothetical protein H7338_01015, partial [Candidatus Sericytochromatia bacterium]|nr:hypothetical protein [Candidatus Sericytochromatia bacterium]
GYRYDYHRTAPHQYRYQVSADSPDGRTGIWQTTFQAENRVGRRADVFAVPAGRWLRLQIDTSWSAAPSLAEVGVFDATASGPLACWLILGDSITSSSLLRQAAWERTHRDKRTPLPVFINGGTSGDTAANGLTQLAKALPLCPPGTFVGLAYGTNDATQAVPLPQFAGQLQRMIAAIRQRGCLPMLARPPWNPNPRLASYVTAIDRLTRDHGLPPGPDLYGWFRQRPQELGPDHLHPTATGEESVQRLWQLAAMRLVSPPSPPVASAQPATGR